MPELNPDEVDQTVATTTFDSTRFLYTGDDPVQTGVDSGTIEYKRASVIRGRVLDENGDPLSGATVRVLNHPELGQTVSREDGFYDMVVNGGGQLTVRVTHTSRLPAQRPVDVPWRDFVRAEPIHLTSVDTKVTTVDLTETQDLQVHEATTQSDSDGTRKARMAFKPNTEATLVRTDGSTEALDSIDVRATEYSVGPNGPEKMPAPLPPQSVYTYAAELSVDQVLEDTTAQKVTFSKPVPYYVDNFLSAPVGSAVPAGFYDRQQGEWVPGDTMARVMQVVSIANNQAQLDVDGDGQADGGSQLAELNITTQEQTVIANQFDAGDSFWRAPVQHFSIFDWNWNAANLGEIPNDLVEAIKDGLGLTCDGCEKGKNTINLHNQTLGEQIDVVGTPFSLNYQSDRTGGFRAPFKLEIPLTQDTIPEQLTGVSLDVEIGGKLAVEKVFDPQTNLRHQFEWDGKDAYGRILQSPQKATVKIAYLFPGAHKVPGAGPNEFARAAGGQEFGLQEAREELDVFTAYRKRLGVFRAKGLRMGGWTLSNHHVYDSSNGILYLGNGSQRRVEPQNTIIETVAGGGPGIQGETGSATDATLDIPEYIDFAPDGTFFFSDRGLEQIWKVTPDGQMVLVAGDGQEGFDGNGGPATEASLDLPFGVARGSDGTIYFAERDNHVIRKVSPDGIISIVAGGNGRGFNGDNQPATQAQLNQPHGVALGPNGGVYFAEHGGGRIRKVTPDGIIHTVAGTGQNGFSGDGGPATEAQLNTPIGIEVTSDGTVYFADVMNNRLRKVTPDGIITTVVGGGSQDPEEANRATNARIRPDHVSVDAEGNIYVNSRFDNAEMFQVTPQGEIFKVAGTGSRGFSGDGGPALRAQLKQPEMIRTGPDGALYLVDEENHRIRRIQSSFPGVSLDQKVIPSEDGSRLFVFTRQGRHLRTVDARTGTTLFSFDYNDAGLLVSVTNRDGQTTTIERDSSGQATAIVSPFGQRTELTTNSNGYLTEVSNPASEAHQMTYSDSGLLRSFTDPKGNETTYTYAENGRLTKEEDPKGGFTELARSFSDTTFQVQTGTAEGRTRSFKVTKNTAGDQVRKNVGTDGLPIKQDRNRDATRSVQRPDGTQMATVLGPDPRFNMQSPIPEGQMITTPGGRELSITQSSSATEGDTLSVASSMDTVSINGRKFVQRYDGSTRTVTNTSPEGRVTTTQLNDQARVAQITQGDLLPTSFTYNDQGQLTQTTQGDRTSEFTYNSEGFLDSVTDPTGRTTQFSYDNAGRVTTQTLPDGRQIGFQYDDNGNLTALTPPGRDAHVFQYSSRDETQEYEPPELPSGATITTWTYNLDKQLTQIQRPDMTTVNFGYDNAGRLSSVGFPADQRTLSYSSSSGNLTGIQSDNGVNLSFAYDGSLPTQVQWDGTDVNGSLSLNYDDNFRITDQTINGSTAISFAYALDGLLTQAGSLQLSRDAQTGLLTGASLGDLQTSWSHNDFGEVTAQSTTYSGNSRYSFAAQRGQAGRIVSLSEDVVGQATRTRSFAYDEVGRLVRVNRGNGDTVGYEYDSNGNRTARTGAGIDQTDFSYDAQDRLLSYRKNGDTLVEFGYTANGELQSKTVGSQSPTTYDYDAMGNLRSVTIKGDTTIDYIVDGKDRRVGKKVNDQFKQGFIYQDHLNPVAELDKNGDVEAIFIYGAKGNVPSYMIKNGIKYRILSNHLGSVRMVVNTSNGNVVQRMKYDAYGRVIKNTNPGFQPFGFAGGVYDHQTGLVRFGVRDYDPRIGRWTLKDPILFSGKSPNLYAYALSDPLNLMDVGGLNFMEFELAGISGGGATVSAVYDDSGNEFIQVGFGAGADGGVSATYSRDTFDPSPSFVASGSSIVGTSQVSTPIENFFGPISPNIDFKTSEITLSSGGVLNTTQLIQKIQGARAGGSVRAEFSFKVDLPGSYNSFSKLWDSIIKNATELDPRSSGKDDC